MLMLGGSMQPYVWTINGATWGQHRPVTARSGERIVLSFHNMSMMGHPMHLHGHVFQVVGVNGRAVAGALRDTVYVPPMSMIDVALDAGEAARWMLHCHHMPHLSNRHDVRVGGQRLGLNMGGAASLGAPPFLETAGRTRKVGANEGGKPGDLLGVWKSNRPPQGEKRLFFGQSGADRVSLKMREDLR